MYMRVHRINKSWWRITDDFWTHTQDPCDNTSLFLLLYMATKSLTTYLSYSATFLYFDFWNKHFAQLLFADAHQKCPSSCSRVKCDRENSIKSWKFGIWLSKKWRHWASLNPLFLSVFSASFIIWVCLCSWPLPCVYACIPLSAWRDEDWFLSFPLMLWFHTFIWHVAQTQEFTF